ncbi:hypothetical protein COM05_29210 [Bacillus toyonensis]|uniref:hemopexin repeat-containing protein n=1 Tax=Bacillus toyonensis TaxID=155322 RepID=UPI000BF40BD5|nr:hemopexin repeat-containing protein [Bacillus toyonensis]PGB76378.1 hypothetical protein COM05_29210 [Bacillus toyonensis]
MSSIKSAIMWPNGKIYFFDGLHSTYYTFDIQSEQYDPNPKPMSDFPGLDGISIEGAIVWPTVPPLLPPPFENAYFFSSDKWYNYKIGSGLEASSPLPTKLNFQGVLPGPNGDYCIHAAMFGPDPFVYFFQYDRYYKYDVLTNRVVHGYPCLIKDDWRGVWTTGQNLTAAFVWPKLIDLRMKVYFFTPTLYMRYDVLSKKVDDGYPKPISGKWIP